jgi:c-di-GMP-binding flagellar brake protein YcgR
VFDLADQERFALHRRDEIVALFERLLAERTVMSVDYADGLTIVSRVLEVRRDAGVLVMDVSSDATINVALFAAPKLFFLTELDQIQIAFESTRAAPIAMSDGPAAAIALPETVVRLQRREWYRVHLPLNQRLLCTVLDRNGNALPAHAVDLSCGGVGVVVDQEALRSQIGDGIELILSLPDGDLIELDATVSNILPTTPPAPGDPVQVRLGFRFEHVSPRTETRLQRCVTRLEVAQRKGS